MGKNCTMAYRKGCNRLQSNTREPSAVSIPLHEKDGLLHDRQDPHDSSTTCECMSPWRILIASLQNVILHHQRRSRNLSKPIRGQKVFGTDLGEHLHNSYYDVPLVLISCAKFIDQHGIVKGIYRRSGTASNIQKLRREMEENLAPQLHDHRDIHSVASVLKMYFHELPNPLCTYKLYNTFIDAIQCSQEVDCRLLHMKLAVQKLPPPNCRTLMHLLLHLTCLTVGSARTGMTSYNLAVVWAPNILRRKKYKASAEAIQQDTKVEIAVTEFLISYVCMIFYDYVPPRGNACR